jgi:hypothetical protein
MSKAKRWIRERRTFSTVMGTGAILVALGGGALAAAGGVPDSGGVFHGCVSKRSGALRVVRRSSECRRAKRRHHHLVNPGEFAIAWNQQGRQGDQGPQGQQGEPGPQGPGATTFTATLPQGTTNGTVEALSNGLTVIGTCTNGPANVVLSIKTTSETNTLQASGTGTNGAGVFRVDQDGAPSIGFVQDTAQVDMDVIARDTMVGTFDRIDVHGSFGVPCKFWGMIVPSS